LLAGRGLRARSAEWLGLALLCAARAVAAEETPPRVDLRLDPPEVTVGDPVTATITLEVPAGTPVAFQDDLKQWGGVAVLSIEAPPPETDGDRQRVRRVLHLAAFETGDLALPPLELRVGEGEGATMARSDAATLRVRSVLGEGEELADLRPPWEPPPVARWLPWVLAALAAAALVGAYRRWRRRRPAESARPAEPMLPPDAEALQALAALLASPLLARGEVKRFHVELAEIVKRYIHRRFGVPTLERTSAEVTHDAQAAGVEPAALALVVRVLQGCDGVKFARQRPEAADCRGRVEQARGLIERTRIAPPAIPDALSAPREG